MLTRGATRARDRQFIEGKAPAAMLLEGATRAPSIVVAEC